MASSQLQGDHGGRRKKAAIRPESSLASNVSQGVQAFTGHRKAGGRMVHAEIIAYDPADGVMRLVPLATGAITYDDTLG